MHPAFALLGSGVLVSLWVWRRYDLRRGVQTLALFLFVGLFWLAALGGRPHWPVDLFLFSDPLVAVVHSVAGRALVGLLLVSIAFVALAAFMGRVFCSHVCPLGTLLDVADRWIAREQNARNNWRGFRRARRVKLVFLLVTIAAALAGVSLLGFGDPIVIFTRFAATLFYPLVVVVGASLRDALGAIGERSGWLDGAHPAASVTPVFEGALLMIGLLAGLLLLSRLQPRFWCRHICPLGALLGWIGRRAPYRRRVSDACTGCLQCAAACPTGAIHADGVGTDLGECIVCLECTRICPEQATSFRFTRESSTADSHGVEVGRRAFVGATAGGLVLAAGMRADMLHPSGALSPFGPRHPGLIRPPGALPEPELLSRCLRCGECMRACPSNTLQPDWYRAGLEGLWAPHLNLRHGACEPSCNVCGLVCPTRAIRPLDLVEKQHAKIGTAVIDRNRCLPWSQDSQCMICEERCPYGAVSLEMPVGGEVRAPLVEPLRCNGCGVCETRCPVQGEAAISVARHGEIRLARGSYVEECRVRGLTFVPKRRDLGPLRVDDSALPGQARERLRELGTQPEPEEPFEFAPPGSEIDASSRR